MSEFGGPAWTLDEQTGHYHHAHLVEQPDLNWRNPEFTDARMDVLRFWFDRGVDGFRIDVVDQAVKDADFTDNPPNPDWHDGRPPTERWLRVDQQDRPELHELVAARMRQVADEAGGRVQLSEAYLPFDRMTAYYGPAGDGFHLPFNLHRIGARREPRVDAALDLRRSDLDALGPRTRRRQDHAGMNETIDHIRLGDGALEAVAGRRVDVPAYDRSTLVPRIVHIGVGGFHRAHLAVYCDDLAARGGDWGICGVGLLDSDKTMADVLARQDHLYTLTTRHGDTTHSRVIGSIIDYIHAPGDTSTVAARIADESTAIVSLTVTEAGYTDTPRNHRTFDTIVAGLARRRDAGLGGGTVMSCDNMTGNGDAARRCVLDAARRHDPTLTDWITANCTFPNAMVDRITPATTDADRRYLLDTYGLVDDWPVVSEPFRQWVIDDDFAAGRPGIDAAGAIITDDVRHWELYKLRLLNAGHTVIAHLAALAGIVHVDEALADPDLRAFLHGFLLEESAPTLAPIPGHPPERYVDDVLDRFANTGVRDQVARICVDSTAKFATFVMPILGDQLDRAGPIGRIAHALAAWAHYLATIPADQQAPDPAGDDVRPLAHAARSDPAEFLVEAVGFSADMVDDTRLATAFTQAYRSIARHGALDSLHRSFG